MHCLRQVGIVLGVLGTLAFTTVSQADEICPSDAGLDRLVACLLQGLTAGPEFDPAQLLPTDIDGQASTLLQALEILEADLAANGPGTQSGPAELSAELTAELTAGIWELRGHLLNDASDPTQARGAWEQARFLDPGQPPVRAFAADGRLLWTLSLGSPSPRQSRIDSLVAGKPPAPAASGDPIRSTGWLRPLPDGSVETVRGEPIPLRGSGAKALLLDFWATWCLPCREELPHLEDLWARYQEQGLQVVAVNMREDLALVLPFADEIGLTAPIGLMNDRLDALELDALPALILADDQGRVRRRWNGFEQGMEIEIETAVRELLAGEIDEPEVLGRLLPGSRDVRVRWSRTALEPFESLSYLPAEEPGRLDLVAALESALVIFDLNGAAIRQIKIPSYAGRLRGVFEGQSGKPLLVGYRPASSRMVFVDWASKSRRMWDAEVPIFDARFLHPDGQDSTLLLATLDGLQSWSPGEETVQLRNGEVRASSLMRVDDGSWRALIPNREVLRLDAEYRVTSRIPVDGASWSLFPIGENGGFGVAAENLVAQAHGRLFGTEPEIALLDGDGHLRVVEQRTGRLLHHSIWENPADLAILDLDGDGRDELFVAAGKRLVVLEATGPGIRPSE